MPSPTPDMVKETAPVGAEPKHYDILCFGNTPDLITAMNEKWNDGWRPHSRLSYGYDEKDKRWFYMQVIVRDEGL